MPSISKAIVCLCAALFIIAAVAIAGVPQKMNYQAILTDTGGAPVTTTTEMIFTIWDADLAGTALWAESLMVTPTEVGQVSIILGEVHPVTEAILSGSAKYLGVKIGTDPEVTGRTELVTVPYAFHSAVADQAMSVADDAVTSVKILDGTITFGDIGQNGASIGQIMKWNGAAWAVAADDAGGASGWTDDGTRVRLDGVGDSVGIGTVTPAEKLDVEGNIHASGTIVSGNSITVDGVTNSITSTSGTINFDNENLFTTGAVEMGGFILTDLPSNGYVLTSNATGVGTWQAAAGVGYWSLGGAGNDVLFSDGNWGIARNGATLHGLHDSTHINLGVGGTTGIIGLDNKYSTISGGLDNVAGGASSTVGGGKLNIANGFYSTVTGGEYNVASSSHSAVGGGLNDTASGSASTVSGGYMNTASGTMSAIGGGWENRTTGTSSTVGGGQSNLASHNYSTVSGGYANIASNSESTVGGGTGNTASGIWSTVGAGVGNTASGDYGTVSGGGSSTAIGASSTVGGGYYNRAEAGFSTIGGGVLNTNSGLYSTTGGGFSDSAYGDSSTVAGGAHNVALGNSSVIGGGRQNRAIGGASTIGGGEANNAKAHYSTISGGRQNITDTLYATVGGGRFDSAMNFASTVSGGYTNKAKGDFATVSGGENNTARGKCATVGGGYFNIADHSFATVTGGMYDTVTGGCATVSGGRENAAKGDYSFAAGRRAKALHDGAFVWADQSDFDFASTAMNEFSACAVGGVRFVSGLDGSGVPNAGVTLAAGGGSWSAVSDKNLKSNFSPVSGTSILEKIAAMPITTWNYKAQDESIRHIGPMAQDFYAAFGLGTDERHIATIDADGVALAAIQGLYDKTKKQAGEIDGLREELAETKSQISNLTALVETLLAERVSKTTDRDYAVVRK